jgi:cellulose synthase/poly-beta-1,6-N-acetylglucosamine synthase-like glycosyltransferase
MTALQVILSVAVLPVVTVTLYLGALTILSARLPERRRRASPIAFQVVVPAHDEERGIADTVASLRSLGYPSERFQVVVVADNCADGTAASARAAGAQVLVRSDAERRGKGYALAFAFERILAAGWAEAVVVVDADTLVSRDLLDVFAAHIEAGAEAIQSEYGVRNPQASWRTRLVAIAFGAFHTVRSRGRERLGLSCGLRGNGMCFTTGILRRVPYAAFSIVEDVEYGVRLGQAGVRVHYAGEASVLGEMAATERASREQRRRWEDGRRRLLGRDALGYLAASLRRGDPVGVDLVADLMIPPLSSLGAVTAVGAVTSALVAVAQHRVTIALGAWWVSALVLVAYVLRGWQLSGTGLRGLRDLLAAPLYVGWKLTLPLRASVTTRGEWVRTPRREEES